MENKPVGTAQSPSAVMVIRQSFRTVAEDFDLTPENCSSPPAFLTEAQLRAQVESGAQLLGAMPEVVINA